MTETTIPHAARSRGRQHAGAQLAAENAMLRRYLDTVGAIALAGEVPLDDLLQRIVENARALLHARYAALGVFDAAGHVTRFYTVGMSRAQRDRIGHLPRGEGLLGLIVRERRIVRIRRIADHPDAVGFPANHPPMTSFLGGPIVRHGVLHGNLYLTDRIGAEEFSPLDEELLAMLASHAAIAIENASRFARARRDERTIHALFDIGRALASLNDPSAVMDLTVREARNLLGSDISGLCLLQSDGRHLRWILLHGETPGQREEKDVPLEGSLAGRVVRSGTPFRSDNLPADLGSFTELSDVNPLIGREGVRSALIVPLGREAGTRGVLMVGWRREDVIPEDGTETLERLADRAAIALRQVELYAREQEALRQSQIERSSLEAIFDSMSEAVFTTDLAGRIIRINRRATILA